MNLGRTAVVGKRYGDDYYLVVFAERRWAGEEVTHPVPNQVIAAHDLGADRRRLDTPHPYSISSPV